MSKKRIPEKIRISVLNRDSQKCLWCGRSAADNVTLDVDHIVAEAWGGNTTEDNLGTLCSHCNRAKGADYFGSYLLTTLFKVKNIENWFENKVGGIDFNRDAICCKLSITFYRNIKETFQAHTILQEYLLSNEQNQTNIPNDSIFNAEKRKEAVLQLKDKIKTFLFENNGFLEELEGNIVFREKK